MMKVGVSSVFPPFDTWSDFFNMQPFFCRPLTWLFVIATACVDAMAIAGVANHESNWFAAVALGQMFLVGSLLVVGHAHRLVRATMFIVVPIVLSVPDYLHEPAFEPSVDSFFGAATVAPHVLGVTLILTALPAAISLALVLLNHLATRHSATSNMTKFQFPVIEFFGWTIVVAIATLTLQAGRYNYFRGGVIFDALAIEALPAAALTHFRSARRTWFLKFALTAALLTSVLPLALGAASAGWQVVVGAYAFIAAWMLIEHMDNAIGAKPLAGDEAR